ncbi:MAG: hypothetical protein NTZ94_15705 [Verrucomicrobia bacterium]|nr:hypothetical protein [Verrucomicrobiota bacterium]
MGKNEMGFEYLITASIDFSVPPVFGLFIWKDQSSAWHQINIQEYTDYAIGNGAFAKS